MRGRFQMFLIMGAIFQFSKHQIDTGVMSEFFLTLYSSQDMGKGFIYQCIKVSSSFPKGLFF